MKRLLAILALVGVVLVVPLTALATDDPEFQEPSDPQGIYAPPAQEQDSVPEIEQDNQGDPDELGGGFRGNGSPPNSTGAGGTGPWLEPLIVLMMNLF